MAKITGKLQSVEMEIKRLYLPGLGMEDNCPKCGKMCTLDFGEIDCLMYPKMNAANEMWMYCNDCDHRWEVPVFLKVSLELAR